MFGCFRRDVVLARFRRVLVIALLALSLVCGPGVAFSPPEGPVVLSVTGHPEAPGPILFDRALLEILPTRQLTTHTIWTEGLQEFTGVPLAALLDHLGVDGGTIRASAANDYAVDIPVDSLTQTAPIVAFLRNGAPMTLRDRGPLWIVYPYDLGPEFRSELIYARSIWQLVQIDLQS